MKNKSIAQERHDSLKAQVKHIMELRLALIDRTVAVAKEAGLESADGLLGVVFARKYTASHMNQWWSERSKKWLERFKQEEAYDAVAAKLTPEERQLLGIRQPAKPKPKPKKKPAKKPHLPLGWSYHVTQKQP